jgi:hypothetical protein
MRPRYSQRRGHVQGARPGRALVAGAIHSKFGRIHCLSRPMVSRDAAQAQDDRWASRVPRSGGRAAVELAGGLARSYHLVQPTPEGRRCASQGDSSRALRSGQQPSPCRRRPGRHAPTPRSRTSATSSRGSSSGILSALQRARWRSSSRCRTSWSTSIATASGSASRPAPPGGPATPRRPVCSRSCKRTGRTIRACTTMRPCRSRSVSPGRASRSTPAVCRATRTRTAACTCRSPSPSCSLA